MTPARAEVWIATLFYQQASALQEEAQKPVSVLGLESDVVAPLTEFSTQGLVRLYPLTSWFIGFTKSCRPTACRRKL